MYISMYLYVCILSYACTCTRICKSVVVKVHNSTNTEINKKQYTTYDIVDNNHQKKTINNT